MFCFWWLHCYVFVHLWSAEYLELLRTPTTERLSMPGSPSHTGLYTPTVPPIQLSTISLVVSICKRGFDIWHLSLLVLESHRTAYFEFLPSLYTRFKSSSCLQRAAWIDLFVSYKRYIDDQSSEPMHCMLFPPSAGHIKALHFIPYTACKHTQDFKALKCRLPSGNILHLFIPNEQTNYFFISIAIFSLCTVVQVW